MFYLALRVVFKLYLVVNSVMSAWTTAVKLFSEIKEFYRTKPEFHKLFASKDAGSVDVPRWWSEIIV